MNYLSVADFFVGRVRRRRDDQAEGGEEEVVVMQNHVANVLDSRLAINAAADGIRIRQLASCIHGCAGCHTI